jgi:hypothetical protein
MRKVLVKIDCYPSRSPIVLQWVAEAFRKAGLDVLAATAGQKYLFGCWDAWITIPQVAYTEANRQRVMTALEALYTTNNSEDKAASDPLLIRGMILEWEGDDDGN